MNIDLEKEVDPFLMDLAARLIAYIVRRPDGAPELKGLLEDVLATRPGPELVTDKEIGD